MPEPLRQPGGARGWDVAGTLAFVTADSLACLLSGCRRPGVLMSRGVPDELTSHQARKRCAELASVMQNQKRAPGGIAECPDRTIVIG